MAPAVNLAAIDAGSNAIRMVVARAHAPNDVHRLKSERFAVRLGHHAFTERWLNEETIGQAIKAFREFARTFKKYEVDHYRAVATSAAREVRNRKQLLECIFGETGIHVEVIDDAEEARLVRHAVQSELGHALAPELILDLGGGSLELSILEDHEVENKIALPVGTVRLLEMFQLHDRIRPKEVQHLESHLLSLFQGGFLQKPDFSRSLVAACGGNAEALCALYPGTLVGGIRTMDLKALRRGLPDLLRLDVDERMEEYDIRRDRAEVIGVAAIIFSTLTRYLKIDSFLIPGVGVREGIMRDLVSDHFRHEMKIDEETSQHLVEASKTFAKRYEIDFEHAEHVVGLALSLFDQTKTLHNLGSRERLYLEMAAWIHDVGHYVNRKFHHKHGEYLVRNGLIKGCERPIQDLLASLVLYHRKMMPDRNHDGYVAFDLEGRRQIRVLSGILRIAESLDCEHHRSAKRLRVEITDDEITLRIEMKANGATPLLEAEERATLCEKEFGRRIRFKKEAA